MSIEKVVNIPIPSLDVVADRAIVTEYREAEGVYVYDLCVSDMLVAKSRYSAITDAPFELTAEEKGQLNLTEEKGK